MSIDLVGPVEAPGGLRGRVVGVVIAWTDESGIEQTATVEPEQVEQWREQPGIPHATSREIKPR